MPKALPADWELLKARYIVGASPKQLADEFAVSLVALRRRIVRGHWFRLRTAVKQDVSQAVEKTLATLQQKSERVRARLADELVRQTETLEVMPSKKNLADLSSRSDLASTVARTASVVFGWNESSEPPPLVNIAVMSSACDPRRINVGPDIPPDTM